MTKVTLHKVKRPRPPGKHGTARPPRQVWMLRWYGSEINPESGNPKRYSETLGDVKHVSVTAVERARRDKQSNLDHRIEKPDKPTRMTLAEFAAYDREAIADRRYKTQLGHDHATGLAKRILGSGAKVSSISRADVARIKAKMRDEGYAAATIDKVIRALRAMWNRGKDDGLVVDNPFLNNGVKWDPRVARIYTAEELDAMVEVAGPWWGVFLRLAVATGLRKEEALHLRWSDVDLDAGTVTVCRHEAGRFTVDGREYPLLPWTAKAKASYRTIPLSHATGDLLRTHKARAGKSAYVLLSLDRLATLDARLQAGTLRPNYEPMNNLLRDFKVIQDNARRLLAKRHQVEVNELPWRVGCIHDLRDTYLTGMKGLPLDVLQRIAGHADIATTIRFYTSETARDAESVRLAVEQSGLAGPTRDTSRDTFDQMGSQADSAVSANPASRYHKPALSA